MSPWHEVEVARCLNEGTDLVNLVALCWILYIAVIDQEQSEDPRQHYHIPEQGE